MKPEIRSVAWVDILQYFWKQKWRLLIIPFIVAVLVAGVTLLMDDKYKSSANILPNEKRSLGLSLLPEGGSNLGSIASDVLGGGGQRQIIDRFHVLLESYTTKKKVVEKFNLIDHYEVAEAENPLQAAMDILADNTSFYALEEGNFIIEVWSEDPKLAKRMADYYVERLNTLNNEISTREATEYRQFIEKRYHKAQQDLDSLRNSLEKFQENYGIYELPQQVSGYFSMLAAVTQKKIESEIKLEVLESSVNTNSDTYQQAKDRYNILTNKLDELYHDEDPKNVILNFDRLPEVGSKYFDLRKGLEVQKRVHEILVPLYEQAKLEEAKALPLVTVVDNPVVPREKSSPKRSLIVILSAISAGLLCLVYYIIKLTTLKNREYFNYIANSTES